MSAPPLWTQHRAVAVSVARDYTIPGLDEDDVLQEALIALWIAARNYDPGKGARFSTFAHAVITRRMWTLLRFATREKRHARVLSLEDVELAGGPDVERVVIDRETLRLIVQDAELTARRRRWRETKRRARARAREVAV